MILCDSIYNVGSAPQAPPMSWPLGSTSFSRCESNWHSHIAAAHFLKPVAIRRAPEARACENFFQSPPPIPPSPPSPPSITSNLTFKDSNIESLRISSFRALPRPPRGSVTRPGLPNKYGCVKKLLACQGGRRSIHWGSPGE